jgi:hypothetical protein
MVAPADDNDRKQLRDFLDSVRSVLDSVVDARSVLCREKLRNPIRDAWQDVRLLIEAAQGELDQADSRLNKALGEAGLSSTQLAFKMQGFRAALDRFVQRGTLSLLGKVLKWINSILQSLLSAIPGAEGIKEFKDSLEAEIEDNDPVT